MLFLRHGEVESSRHAGEGRHPVSESHRRLDPGLRRGDAFKHHRAASIALVTFSDTVSLRFIRNFLGYLCRYYGAQHRLRFSQSRPVAEPPHRAFLDRPVGFAAGEQQCCGATERGLVANDEDGVVFGLAAVRPVDGGKQGRWRCCPGFKPPERA